jgi:DNA (cytosine-5)-methyltransferase 1
MLAISKEKYTALSNLTFIDLFAGIGGFRLALDSFGAKCVFTSEWDKDAQKVYKENFKDEVAGDITKIKEEDVPKHDILCAGFPCQAFSISGKQQGFDDARGTLFFDVARIVKYHQPKILLLENVKNFETHDHGKTLQTVKQILEEKTLLNLGYSIFYQVLNASNYGIPQKRQRIYILGFRNDLGITNFDFPKPIKTCSKIKDLTLSDKETEKYVIKRTDIILDDARKIEGNIKGSIINKAFRIGIVNKGGQGERIYSENGHAITLSAYGGGVGAKTGLYLINGKIRKLAPRECARVMGFPEDFKISKSKTQSYKQFGNSVVVDVLQYILKEICNQKILEPKV